MEIVIKLDSQDVQMIMQGIAHSILQKTVVEEAKKEASKIVSDVAAPVQGNLP